MYHCPANGPERMETTSPVFAAPFWGRKGIEPRPGAGVMVIGWLRISGPERLMLVLSSTVPTVGSATALMRSVAS